MPDASSDVNNFEVQPTKKTQSRAFVRLYRDVLEQFEGNPLLLGSYIAIMNEVAYGDFVVNLRSKHPVKPGQFVTTMQRLCNLIRKDHRTAKWELAVLAEMGVITVQQDKQTLIITNTDTANKSVIEAAATIGPRRSSKLGSYPSSEPVEVGQLPNFKLGSYPGSSPSSWAATQVRPIPTSIDKKKKNKKKEKEDPLSLTPSVSKIKVLKYSPDDLERAGEWLEYAKREMKWTKPPPSWTQETFALGIYKVKAACNLNSDGIRAMLKFVENSPFWVDKALSPTSLLKRNKDGLLKADVILLQMRPQSDRQREKIERWDDSAPVNPLFKHRKTSNG